MKLILEIFFNFINYIIFTKSYKLANKKTVGDFYYKNK